MELNTHLYRDHKHPVMVEFLDPTFDFNVSLTVAECQRLILLLQMAMEEYEDDKGGAK